MQYKYQKFLSCDSLPPNGFHVPKHPMRERACGLFWTFLFRSHLILFKDPPQKTTTLKKYKHLLDIQLMTTETSLSWMSCLWQLMNWPFIFLKAKKLEREWLRKLARSKMTLVKIAKLLTYSTFPKNSIMILGYFDVCRNW